MGRVIYIKYPPSSLGATMLLFFFGVMLLSAGLSHILTSVAVASLLGITLGGFFYISLPLALVAVIAGLVMLRFSST